MMKKTIDAWLFWAYQDQLPLVAPPTGYTPPTGFGRAWDKVGDWLVGGTNQFGVVHALGQQADCDPFAVRIANHVATLAFAPLDLPDGWNPCADFPDLGPEGAALPARVLAAATHIDCQGERRLKYDVADLVRRYAMTRHMPDWQVDPPRRDVERNWNGEPRWFVKMRVPVGEDAFGNVLYDEREMEGWNATRRRPRPGAYQKVVLAPDPVPALVARAEYELLHGALAVLVDEWAQIAEGFGHEVLPSPLPAQPWVTGGLPGVVPVEDLAAQRELQAQHAALMAAMDAEDERMRALDREKARLARARRRERMALA